MPEAKVGRDAIIPLHRPLDPDESIEFHAARLLLLLLECGEGGSTRVSGRTKLAKLDFFARYPDFLRRALNELQQTHHRGAGESAPVEAPMIRYRYGPWDPRYREFLLFLESRRLILVDRTTRLEKYRLSASGRRLAVSLSRQPEFAPLVARLQEMAVPLSSMSGTELKELIYQLFPREIGNLQMTEVIS